MLKNNRQTTVVVSIIMLSDITMNSKSDSFEKHNRNLAPIVCKDEWLAQIRNKLNITIKYPDKFSGTNFIQQTSN